MKAAGHEARSAPCCLSLARHASSAHRRKARRGKRPDEWLLPPNGELSAEQVALVIAARLKRFHGRRAQERAAWLRAKEEALAKPSLSPQLRGYKLGCPPNSSTRVPEGGEAIAGVGCHSCGRTSFPAPGIFSPMGSEGACAWVGHAPFTDTKHTLREHGRQAPTYHSGLLAIRAAVERRTWASPSRSSTTMRLQRPAASRCRRPALHAPARSRRRRCRIVVVTDLEYGRNAPFAQASPSVTGTISTSSNASCASSPACPRWSTTRPAPRRSGAAASAASLRTPRAAPSSTRGCEGCGGAAPSRIACR